MNRRKKLMFLVLGLAVLWVLLGIIGYAFTRYAHPKVLVVGHRGDRTHFSENMLESFQGAERIPVDVIETDVRRTYDGVVVVTHDDDVSTTSNWHGLVSQMTLAQLKELDFTCRFDPDAERSFPVIPGRGIRIMTLEELLTNASLKKPLLLDFKETDPALADAVVAVVRKCNAFDRATFCCYPDSKNQSVADRVRQLVPDAKSSVSGPEILRFKILSWLHLGWIPGIFNAQGRLMSVPFSFKLCGLNLTVPTATFVSYAHAQGMTVVVWTVDDQPSMRSFISYGVDGIMSNNPVLLKSVVDSYNRQHRSIIDAHW